MLNRDDVLRMAREALADVHWNVNGEPLSVLHSITGLERFAALVEAEVTERCAKICEEGHEWDAPCFQCHVAIRARAGGA